MSLSIEAYIETALWSETTYEGTPLDSVATIDDLEDAFLDECQKDLDAFMEKARHLFTDEELDEAPIEHDFWLTRNHHGAGFWDGDYENGDALTEIAHEFGEVDLNQYLTIEIDEEAI